jgi:hypothetical protein
MLNRICRSQEWATCGHKRLWSICSRCDVIVHSRYACRTCTRLLSFTAAAHSPTARSQGNFKFTKHSPNLDCLPWIQNIIKRNDAFFQINHIFCCPFPNLHLRQVSPVSASTPRHLHGLSLFLIDTVKLCRLWQTHRTLNRVQDSCIMTSVTPSRATVFWIFLSGVLSA